MTPEQRHREALRRLEATCYLAEPGVECEGRLQAAHYPLPKRILYAVEKRLGLPEGILVADPRNGFRACVRHHHLLDYGGLVVPREEWPIRYRSFEEQFDLRHVADRLCERRYRTMRRVWSSAGATS